MSEPVTNAVGYFTSLGQEIGQDWNRYWFIPRTSVVLGLLRLFTGIVALIWYLSFAPFLNEWIGPDGLISADVVRDYRNGRWAFSVFDWVADVYGLWLLYGLGVIAIVEMMIGYKSRATTPLATIMVLSMFHRAPIMLGAGEDLLALLMVYLSLAPSGDHWSLDAWLRSRSEKPLPQGLARWRGTAAPSRWTNIAIRLIRVHFGLWLMAMFVAQLNQASWWNGTATWAWLTRVDSRWYDASWLSSYPYLIQAWTFSLLLWEAATALISWPKLRPLLIGWGVILWGSIAVTGGIWLLPTLVVICSLAYWEPQAS